MTLGDYVRDAGALACLFFALLMPWDLVSEVNDHWWVILSLLIAMLGLAVPYLLRARVIEGFNPRHSVWVKFALATPVLVSSLAVVVADLASIGEGFYGSGSGGIGAGVGVSLAGALLMAQPRLLEHQALPGSGRGWLVATKVTASLVILAAIAATAAFFAQEGSDISYLLTLHPALIALLVCTVAVGLPLIVLGIPLAQLLAGKPSGAPLLAVVAWTVVVSSLGALSRPDYGDAILGVPAVDSWRTLSPGTFLIGATAALAVSHGVHRPLSMAPLPVVVSLCRTSMLVSGLWAAATSGVTSLFMVAAFDIPAALVVLLVLCLVATALAFLSVLLASDIRRNRIVLIPLIGTHVVLNVVLVTLIVTQGETVQSIGHGLNSLESAAMFGLPIFAAVSLFLPHAVRSLFPSRPVVNWDAAPSGGSAWDQPAESRHTPETAYPAGEGRDPWGEGRGDGSPPPRW